MLIEDYCNFETAKLLKEKGFVQPLICQCQVYNPQGGYELTEETIYAPTQALAMKWLREVHHITIGITFSLDIITYEIQKDEEVIVAIGSSRSYEDMVEEAIKYCLENLI